MVEEPWETEVPLFWVGTPRRFHCTGSLWALQSQGSLEVAPAITWPHTHERPPQTTPSVSRSKQCPSVPPHSDSTPSTASSSRPRPFPPSSATPHSEHLAWTPAATSVSVLGLP